MAGYGYSYVTDKGFASFSRELEGGAWKDVSIKKHDADGDPPLAKSSLLHAPLPVLWKLRATWSIRGLARAMGSATADDLVRLDAEWDSSQRALNLALLTAGEHREPEHRAAAERLRSTLLLGGGTAQTQLSYEKEVDFGYAQLDLAGRPPLQADAKLVGLRSQLERVREATEALAAGLGRGSGEKRTVSRTRRIRDALRACSTTFNTIHEKLGWLIEHSPAGEDREQLEALRAPFMALLDRYPPRTKTSAEEVEDEPGEGKEPASGASA
jgi:hypothetical protein